MEDPPPSTSSKVEEINNFLHTTEGDYLSLWEVTPKAAQQIRGLISEADLEAADARITYDAEYSHIRITKSNALISTAATWLQHEEAHWQTLSILPPVYYNDITSFSRVEYRGFSPPHSESFKTPNFAMATWTSIHPSVVVETAFTQPVTDLEHDKMIWKDATEGRTKVIILTKFSMTARGTISGVVSISRVNGLRGVSTCAKYTIFPAPQTMTEQNYHISLGEVYGGDVPDGVDPDIELVLRISVLRAICLQALKMSNLKPDY